MKSGINIGLCGAHGYVGQMLIKLILSHPHLTLTGIFARKSPGRYQKEFPVYSMHELVEKKDQIDVLLLAMPPEASIEIVASLKESPIKIIDLSGAFRLPQDELYQWYGIKHDIPSLLGGASYGLSPWGLNGFGDQNVLANPGCYATCALMSLIPLLAQGLIKHNGIVIDAKSGVSGAGKKTNPDLMFCEMKENFFPYKVGKHQHIPEINKALIEHSNKTCGITFVTHMLPVTRGISMSVYADSSANYDSDETIAEGIAAAYQDAYTDYPLIQWGEINQGNAEEDRYLLALKNVVGTPNTHIAYYVERGKVCLFTCIDNLLKGAASQAIENINALYHLPVETGLLKMGGLL